jgi:hypothetical protein
VYKSCNYAMVEAVNVGKRVPVCHLLSQISNLSVVPTGPPEGTLGDLEVISCNKTIIYFISKWNCKIMMCKPRENHSPNLDPSCFNLGLFFIRT